MSLTVSRRDTKRHLQFCTILIFCPNAQKNSHYHPGRREGSSAGLCWFEHGRVLFWLVVLQWGKKKTILSHSHKFCMLDRLQIVNKLECVHFFLVLFWIWIRRISMKHFHAIKVFQKNNKNNKNKWVKSFPSSASFRKRGYRFPPWELLRLTKTREATWKWLDTLTWTASSIPYRIGHLKHCAFKCARGVVALHYCPPVCSS